MGCLTFTQIEAACALRARPELASWVDADVALERLAECFPDNTNRSHALAKACAIDKLYSTREGNIYWVADAIVQVARALEDGKLRPESGVDIVDAISHEKKDAHPRARRCASFASKYCHFFVDGWDFPIYDSFALSAVLNIFGRVGRGQITRGASEYGDFCERLALLRARDGLQDVGTREMDRYLWLWGQYLVQRGRTDAAVNEDVHLLLGSKDPAVEALLEQVTPSAAPL